jgi:hypothetical protein
VGGGPQQIASTMPVVDHCRCRRTNDRTPSRISPVRASRLRWSKP